MQTKSAARNIFFGGTIFFFVVFAALVAHSHMYILNTSTPPLNDAVVRGKHVWERHACINCHTILGEGAYYAPELGNACKRLGGKEAVKGIIEAYQAAEEPVRQMPNFGIAGQDLDDLAEFLCWTSKIKTQNWPPNDAG
jgi:nitric oxide reductase subunit C